MQTLERSNRWGSPEDKADRIGERVAWAVLWVALILAGVWFISVPSFEKCSALGTQSERIVCYENLRDELLKPPAKGGSPPALSNSDQTPARARLAE